MNYSEYEVRRAATIDDMGRQLWLDLKTMPAHDRLMVAIWLVTVCALDHPKGFKWCSGTVGVAMESAPVSELQKILRILKGEE